MDVLGISLTDILLHLANLLVLIAVVYFVLYKKIRAYMKKRSDEYRTAEENIAAKTKEVEDMKSEYAGLLGKANNEIARINEEAAVTAEMQAKAIIEDAKKNAKVIVEKADGDMRIEKAKMKAEFKNEVAEIAVDIAEKILMREIKGEDTEKVIDESLSEWLK
ncbi:MAG: ATP synthase F0 subunit B [Clostridiales bacterium]|jgi:F-type H+-transporting ATPase subunit b|nr:ATP synthase F0 subunit B [Clostridiales bacterium]